MSSVVLGQIESNMDIMSSTVVIFASLVFFIHVFVHCSQSVFLQTCTKTIDKGIYL